MISKYTDCYIQRMNLMIIKGIQKVTLLDFPGRVACTVFTGGCNFRCPFCQNSELVIGSASIPSISVEDVFDLLKKRRGLLDGICISGGEPLLQSDIESFIDECHNLGYLVKLDTNGYEYERLAALISNGKLDYVAMDIKSSPERYGVLAGMPDFNIEPILKSVELLKACGIEHEFRTTVVHELHSADDFEYIGRWLKGEKHYFLQKFVDSGEILQPNLSAPSDETMNEYLRIVQRYIPDAEKRM